MEQLRNIQDYHILRYSSQKTVEKQKNSSKTKMQVKNPI